MWTHPPKCKSPQLTPVRRLVATGTVLAIALMATSCFFDRRSDAEEMNRHVRAMPGVADTQMHYDKNLTSGENFDLTVTLRQDVTEAQIRDLGRYFADRTDATGLAERSADLSLRLPIVPPPPKTIYSQDYQSASFQRGSYSTKESPSGDVIADDAAAWLRMARSPIVADANLTAPNWNGTGDSRSVQITLTPNATQAQALALQSGEPMLADARWGIAVQDAGLHQPHTYYATPRPPSDTDLQTWREVSALIGPYEEGTGETHVPVAPGKQAESVVEFAIATDAGSQAEARRVSFGVPALLQRFGRPVAVTVRTVDGPAKFIVGGCYQHEPEHVRLPLEIELSTEFERC